LMSAKSKKFRFYPSIFPMTGEIVMTEVIAINNMGAYVSLLEYNRIEGMIPLSELTKKRLKSWEKFVKAGKQEPAIVLCVNSQLNYIDLSRRRVSREEAIVCEYRYQKAKTVHTILCQVSMKTRESLEFLYQTIAWPLAKIYGSSSEAMLLIGQFSDEVFSKLDTIPNKSVQTVLIGTIKQKMTSESLRIRSSIEINCLNYDGILLIQEASRVTQNIVSKIIKHKIEWRTIAAPIYLLSMFISEESTGVNILHHVIQEYALALLSHQAKVNIKVKPHSMNLT